MSRSGSMLAPSLFVTLFSLASRSAAGFTNRPGNEVFVDRSLGRISST